MPIEGATVYQLLRREADSARAEADRARSENASAEQSARALVERKGAALLDLARHYLPEMTRAAIEQTMAGARESLLAVLAEKERAEADLRARSSEAEQRLRACESALDAVTERLNAKVRQREALEAKVAEALKADPDFQRRSELAAKAEADLHRDERRVAELHDEALRKLPAYERSRLFRYLYERGFGTPEYQHRGWVRGLDRWVARLIGFSNARVGYEFLSRTPALVEAEVARRRSAFDELMGQVEALQKQRADALGLTAVLEDGNALGAERDRAVAQRQDAQQRLAAIEAELASLGGTRNRFYEDALERFRAFLAETSTTALAERARRTPEPEDDALVASVLESETALRTLEENRRDRAGRLAAAERRSSELQQIVLHFRASNYDSTRSYFTDQLDVNEALARLQSGQWSQAALWTVLAQSQRFRPHQVEAPPAPGAAGAVIEILSRPETRILINAIGSVVSAALRDSAQRGVERRVETRSGPWGGGFHVPSPPTGGGPSGGSRSGGGFTSGEGF
jgi:hypothetical protein